MDEISLKVKEMVEFCDETQNYSYYELKDYAIKNRPFSVGKNIENN